MLSFSSVFKITFFCLQVLYANFLAKTCNLGKNQAKSIHSAWSGKSMGVEGA